MNRLKKWMNDDDPHVRRLCSEGTRPRLPWANKINAFAIDPSPVIPILEHLKNDPVLYVRRSVATHVGDIAKDHPDLAFDLCEKWLKDADKELKWVIRHAVRNPFKKGNARAIALRADAKYRVANGAYLRLANTCFKPLNIRSASILFSVVIGEVTIALG